MKRDPQVKISVSTAMMLFAGMASAHATLTPLEAQVGAAYNAIIRIGHGCDGEATHTVRVTIPEGFYNAKPMPKPGWTLKTVRGSYTKPYVSHGVTYEEGVQEIIWSGGALQDDWYDEFAFRGTFGPELEAGAEFYFPTVQTCHTGQVAWTERSAVSDAPAPSVVLAAADEPAQAMPMHESAMLGDLTLTNAFAFATLPHSPVAGAFLTITNDGETSDKLVSASSPIAGMVQVHEMAMDGDVMKMRELADGLKLPAGETVMLKPGGYHIMLMDLREPLVEGEAVDITLQFENAGTITLPFGIQSRTRGAGHEMKH